MIFSRRRKKGAPAADDGEPLVLVATDDGLFADNIARTVVSWGFTCRRVPAAGEPGGEADGEADVALLDIREGADGVAAQVRSLKGRHAGIEVLLINRPDNVAASIAGMQAGAMDEVIAPFDTGVLRTMLAEAAERRRRARMRWTKRSILARFSDAMMAATFAQAGDFDGALNLFDGRLPAAGGRQAPDNKNGGS